MSVALPSEALRKRRKSLNLHFLVKGIEDKNEDVFELLLLVEEETLLSSESHTTMSEILKGDNDLLPLRPETETLSLLRCVSSCSSLLRVSFIASAKGSKSFFFLRGESLDLGDVTGV